MDSLINRLTGKSAVSVMATAHEAAQEHIADHRGASAILRVEAKKSETNYVLLLVHLGAIVLEKGEDAAKAYIAELSEAQKASDMLAISAEQEEELLSRQQTGAKGGGSLFGEGLG